MFSLVMTFSLYSSESHATDRDKKAGKIYPLPDIAEFNPDVKYRKVDKQFLKNTKYATDYVKWVELRTSVKKVKRHYADKIYMNVYYLNNEIVKEEIATPYIVAYYKNYAPVVMYVYLEGKDKMHSIQYYNDWKLKYMQVVDGPDESNSAWYVFTKPAK